MTVSCKHIWLGRNPPFFYLPQETLPTVFHNTPLHIFLSKYEWKEHHNAPTIRAIAMKSTRQFRLSYGDQWIFSKPQPDYRQSRGKLTGMKINPGMEQPIRFNFRINWVQLNRTIMSWPPTTNCRHPTANYENGRKSQRRLSSLIDCRMHRTKNNDMLEVPITRQQRSVNWRCLQCMYYVVHRFVLCVSATCLQYANNFSDIT